MIRSIHKKCTRMKSKIVDQDVNAVFLLNKGLIVEYFVGRNYDKILIFAEKLSDNIRFTRNRLGSGVDRMLKSSVSAF